MAKKDRRRQNTRPAERSTPALAKLLVAGVGVIVVAGGITTIWQTIRPWPASTGFAVRIAAVLSVALALTLWFAARRQRGETPSRGPRRGNWRHWGDHPYIVTALLVSALSSLLIAGASLYVQVHSSSGSTSIEDPFSQVERLLQSSVTGRSRRLLPHVIDRFPSACDRQGLRKQLVWDVLESSVRRPDGANADTGFRFDSEHSEWHLLGDLVLKMRDDDGCTRDFWRWWELNVKQYTVSIRWPTDRVELAKLYAWIEVTYIGTPVAPASEKALAARPTVDPPSMIGAKVLLVVFGAALTLLIAASLHRFALCWRYHAFPSPTPPQPLTGGKARVLVQVPIFNERHVAVRCLRAVGRLAWPADRLHIQVIDDSTDETSALVQGEIVKLAHAGVSVQHLRRSERRGFKAGALDWGLSQAAPADLVCLFDADFVPPPDFLLKTTAHFADQHVGLVQCRWTYLNEKESWLTRLQALILDGHFVVDHGGRFRSGCYFNFNGTAGVWRCAAIRDAGGWHTDTLTEDLDISYRAQLRGWKFVYRQDVVVPCELPADPLSFKAQQRRWSRGSFQTARKLLSAIWRSTSPLRCKVEATAHLLTNGSFALVLLVGVLLFPAHYYGWLVGWTAILDLELALLVAGFTSAVAFYLTGGHATGRQPVATLFSVLMIFVLGMGVAVNNGGAAIRGLFGSTGEFVRTPKYGAPRRGGGLSYGKTWALWPIVAEWILFAYLTFAVSMTVRLIAGGTDISWRLLFFPTLYAVSLGIVITVTSARLLQEAFGTDESAISESHPSVQRLDV